MFFDDRNTDPVKQRIFYELIARLKNEIKSRPIFANVDAVISVSDYYEEPYDYDFVGEGGLSFVDENGEIKNIDFSFSGDNKNLFVDFNAVPSMKGGE